MATDDPRLNMYLQRGEKPEDAWVKFAAFVKGAGGNDVNINNDRDFFDQWKTSLNLNEDGVRFERSSYGPNGVMTAYAFNAVENSYRKLTKQV